MDLSCLGSHVRENSKVLGSEKLGFQNLASPLIKWADHLPALNFSVFIYKINGYL